MPQIVVEVSRQKMNQIGWLEKNIAIVEQLLSSDRGAAYENPKSFSA